MSEQVPTPQASPDITSDDKLFAALDYVFAPLVPIIVMLMEDKKNRPFLKAHNAQSLVTGILFWIVLTVIAPFTCGISYLGWLVMLFLGYKAYQGEHITIPVITDFVKNQGWA